MNFIEAFGTGNFKRPGQPLTPEQLFWLSMFGILSVMVFVNVIHLVRG